jgi:RNA polymerase sigma-70 factor (ECF subfamily)
MHAMMEAAADTPDETLEPSDEVLVSRARAGERAALDQLVKRHHQEVTRLLWRFARRHVDLQDLVQEAFLRIVRGLPSWRAEQPFIHWLRRLTVNVGRDFCRRETVRRRWTSEPTVDDSGNTVGPEAIEPGADPAARAAAIEIKDYLAQLPPDDRCLLTLYHLEGWDFASIGRHLGWSATATKLRAFRARRRLRALLLAPETSL